MNEDRSKPWGAWDELPPEEAVARRSELERLEASKGNPYEALLDLIRSRQSRYPRDQWQLIEDQVLRAAARGTTQYVVKQAELVTEINHAVERSNGDFWRMLQEVEKVTNGQSIDPFLLVGLIARGNTKQAAAARKATEDFLSRRQSELGKRSHEGTAEQEEKLKVRAMWDDWQLNRKLFRFKAEFARHALSKCQNLKSTDVVARWCREWEKEKRIRPAKS